MHSYLQHRFPTLKGFYGATATYDAIGANFAHVLGESFADNLRNLSKSYGPLCQTQLIEYIDFGSRKQKRNTQSNRYLSDSEGDLRVSIHVV